METINDKSPNWRTGGKLYLLRCFNCEPTRGRENWMMAVATGQCAWCGWSEEGEGNLKAEREERYDEINAKKRKTNMICPICSTENERSRVFPGLKSVSKDSVPVELYDEDGQYHYHDSREHRQEFRCSRNHTWTRVGHASCPQCGDAWREDLKPKQGDVL